MRVSSGIGASAAPVLKIPFARALSKFDPILSPIRFLNSQLFSHCASWSLLRRSYLAQCFYYSLFANDVKISLSFLFSLQFARRFFHFSGVWTTAAAGKNALKCNLRRICKENLVHEVLPERARWRLRTQSSSREVRWRKNRPHNHTHTFWAKLISDHLIPRRKKTQQIFWAGIRLLTFQEQEILLGWHRISGFFSQQMGQIYNVLSAFILLRINL